MAREHKKDKTSNAGKKKVTAMISSNLLNKVGKYTKAKNTTESLVIALEDWVRQEELRKLFGRIKQEPLEFRHSAKELRELNRKIT